MTFILVALIVVALIAVIVLRAFGKPGPDDSSYVQRSKANAKIARNIIAVVGGVLLLALCASTTLFTVPANHVGVEVLFGKPRATHGEGLHLKNPFASVVNIPGLQQESTYSATFSEGEVGGADAVEAVTSDNAVVNVDASVLWNLDLTQATEIYREYRELYQIRRRLLRPVSRDVIRDCVAQHPFEEARTANRAAIATCAESGIRAGTESKGIVINAVQIRNMRAQSGQLQDSIDRKLEAEQAAREAEFRRDQARVDAETARIAAEGEAAAEIARAEGVKQSNLLVSESLTPELLEYRRYEFLSQSGNTNWVIGGDSGVGAPQLVIDMTNGSTPQTTEVP